MNKNEEPELRPEVIFNQKVELSMSPRLHKLAVGYTNGRDDKVEVWRDRSNTLERLTVIFDKQYLNDIWESPAHPDGTDETFYYVNSEGTYRFFWNRKDAVESLIYDRLPNIISMNWLTFENEVI